ncbi:MAG: FAD-dependent oxidoreductase [bacterium]
MAESAEILVVGAGVAGLATALQLGRRGREVLVLDRAPAPRDRVCGEGLMPAGLAALQGLGLPAGEIAGKPFGGLVFRTQKRAHRLAFSPGVSGRGMRRTELLAALERAVADCPSVRLRREEILGLRWEGGRITGVRGRGGDYNAGGVVAADGANGRLARAAGIRLVRRGYRMALRRHYRLPAGMAGEWVRVGFFAPYDIYLTPVGSETLLATTMTTRAGYRKIVGDYDGFLQRSPFAEIFADAQPASAQLGWYHPLQFAAHHHGGGMAVVGDAGGGLDPALGLGMSLALLTADLAARALAENAGLPGPPPAAGGGLGESAAGWYDAQCRKLFQHYRLFDRIFRLAIGSARGAELMLAGMNLWPAAAAAVFRIVAEGQAWSSLLRGGAARADSNAAGGPRPGMTAGRR